MGPSLEEPSRLARGGSGYRTRPDQFGGKSRSSLLREVLYPYITDRESKAQKG